MIRNRLSVLLAERGLKITKVAKDTGISRNTITSTAQNDGKMIQLETINTLCIYLGITPGEFFEFSEYEVNFTVFSEEKYHSDDPFKPYLEITAYMDFEKGANKYSLEFLGDFERIGYGEDIFHYDFSSSVLKLQNDADYRKIRNEISVTFWADIIKNFSEYISDHCTSEHEIVLVPEILNIVFE